MHYRNELWWKHCKEKYSKYLNNKNSKMIEFGSYNINGSIKDIFTEHSEYLGIDWRPQEGYVDIVSLAHELSIDHKFNVVLSASMLEHDPYWDKSLSNMLSLMEDDGIMLLSWGAALNSPHCFAESPDGLFHGLKAGLLIRKLEELGMYIHEFRYEGLFCPNLSDTTYNGMGEVVLVAFKNKEYSTGDKEIDFLLDEDKG